MGRHNQRRLEQGGLTRQATFGDKIIRWMLTGGLALSWLVGSSYPITLAQPQPDEWTAQSALQVKGSLVGPTETGKIIYVSLPLPLADPAGLQKLLHDLYDPAAPGYHQFLTPAQFTGRFVNGNDRTQIVTFLQKQGLEVESGSLGAVVSASGTVAQVEQAFHVQINNYRDAKGRLFYASDRSPALPAALGKRVQTIFGLDNSLQVSDMTPPASHAPTRQRRPSPTGNGPSGCAAAQAIATSDGAFTPNQLATAYSFDPLYAANYKGQGGNLALVEFDNYSDSAVQAYQTCFGTNVPLSRILVNQNNAPTPGGSETRVETDIEVAVGLAPGLNGVKVYEAPGSGNDFLTTVQRIANDNSAEVVSSGWGFCEAQLIPTYQSFEISLNAVYQQMAAQGQSYFNQAGDTGSAGCLDITGSTALSPADPANQPYVTAVGGTSLYLNPDNTRSDETVWNAYTQSNGAGGGGISTYWSKPTYQQNAVFTNTYSNGFRQTPDVTAVADRATGYVVNIGGNFTSTGGTGLATPVWAAATTILNQYSSAHGHNRVGFANPAFYNAFVANPGLFNDITAGTNCYTSDCGNPPTSGAYPATAGYDQASGLGSLNLSALSLGLNQATTLTLTSSPNPSTFSQPVVFTATLNLSNNTPLANSQVTFREGTTILQTAPTNANGQATIILSNLSLGQHLITAFYSGTATINSATSNPVTQAVNIANTATSLTVAPNPSAFGQSVTLTATVTTINGTLTPIGTVTFRDGAGGLATVSLDGNGQAAFTTASFDLGSHSLSADYNGATSYAASNSPTVNLSVNQAGTTTSLVSAPNPSSINQSLLLTATVSSVNSSVVPTGTVTFKDGSTVLATVSLDASGVATYTTSSLSLGQHPLVAAYNGSPDFTASLSNQINQLVTKIGSKTVLTTSSNPGFYGQSLTFTATVSALVGNQTPTGTVTFQLNGGDVGTVNLNASGVASYTSTPLPIGTYNVGATYNGSPVFSTSTGGPLSQVVTKANTSVGLVSSPSPSFTGDTVTFTATVTSITSTAIPTGTIVFRENQNGTIVSLFTTTLNSNGQAKYITNTLSLGTHTFRAAYLGGPNFNASLSSQFKQQVGCGQPLVVQQITDDGNGNCGTLSGALYQAEQATTPVSVTFSLPTPIITTTGEMPAISPNVSITIAGGCTPGSNNVVGQPGVRLVAASPAVTTGLTLSKNMILQGLAITGFGGYGLEITGDNNRVNCSWIGTANGTSAAPNGGGGVRLAGSHNQLGGPGTGNLIAGNNGPGLLITPGSLDDRLTANLIGYQKDGTTPLRNGGLALQVLAGAQLLFGPGNRIHS